MLIKLLNLLIFLSISLTILGQTSILTYSDSSCNNLTGIRYSYLSTKTCSIINQKYYKSICGSMIQTNEYKDNSCTIAKSIGNFASKS